MIERLARLKLPEPESSPPSGRPCGPLELLRAWPRDDGHLVLEYVDAQGRRIPGQWVRDRDQRRKIARQTAQQAPDGDCVVTTDEGVVLQARGADRRLPGLARLGPGCTLVAHRPERRAVLRLDDAEGRRWAKVVRPSHVGALLEAARYLAAAPGRPFDVPEVLECDEERGVIVFSALPGVAMFELLEAPARLADAARSAGAALRWLNGQRPPGARGHGAEAEMALLEERLERLATFHPRVHRLLGTIPAAVMRALAAGTSPPGLVHRDFYDKQVLAGPGGRIGLLDFDTLAVGEPALDVANMLVHFELRALQDRAAQSATQRGAAAFLDGYGPRPEVASRLPAWGDAARLRLACLYAYRPRWSGLPGALLARIGEPLPA